MLQSYIKQSTTTQGTGPLTLTPLAGYATFLADANNETFAADAACLYAVQNGPNGINKETGIGTILAGGILARTTPLTTIYNGVHDASSPAPINLVGDSIVFCDINAPASATVTGFLKNTDFTTFANAAAIVATLGSAAFTSASAYDAAGTASAAIAAHVAAGDPHTQYALDSDLSAKIGGSGTTNTVPKFTASGTIGNSGFVDDGASLSPSTDNVYDIGSSTKTIRKVFLSAASGVVTSRSGVRGLHSYHADGDIFVGEDNVYPGYYVQKTVVTNSGNTGSADDYTNLYQGNSLYPMIEVNYTVGTASLFGGVYPNVRVGATSFGYYDSGSARGGGGIVIHGRAIGAYMYVASQTGQFAFTVAQASKSSPFPEIAFGGTGIVRVSPIASATIDLGSTTLKWKSAHFSATVNAANFVGAHDGTVGATTPAAGIFTSLQADSITNDTGLAAGTYTPTLSNTTNVGASTARQCTYMRLGNTVSVDGQFDIDPALTATATALGISLPIASAFTTAYQLGGTANATAVAGMSAGIEADATNDRAVVKFVATDINNQTMTFHFSYEVT